MDREKVIRIIDELIFEAQKAPTWKAENALRCLKKELLKEQEKKQITVHKRHVITLRRHDEFSMRKLYESICETMLDEGTLIISRTDDHEKVEFLWEIKETDS